MNEVLLKHITTILVDTAKNKDLIEYSQLSRKLDNVISPIALNTPLGEISIRCIRAGYPPLSVLVVNKEKKMSGDGFFTWVAEKIGYPNLPEREWNTFFEKQLSFTYQIDNWDELLMNFSGIKESNTWIFQGNPKRFKIDEYLNENKLIWWTVNQEHYLEHIKLNDQVFIWRADGGAKGTGGIIARGVICGDAKKVKAHPEYWIDSQSKDHKLQVPIKLLEVQTTGNYIRREKLLEHSILNDLLILKVANSTNYKVELDHALVLQELWKTTMEINREKTFDNGKFKTSLEKQEYLQSKNPSYYILTAKKYLDKENKSNYTYDVLIVKDNSVIVRNSRSNEQKKGLLTKVKNLGLKLLFEIDPKISIENVAMVHYKQDRPHDKKWVAESEDDLANRYNKISLHYTVKKDIEHEIRQDDSYYKEGQKIYYHGNRYERNAKNRAEAIEIHGFVCKVCGFNFEEVYGEIGKDYIEVHHINPLSSFDGEGIEINPEMDLIPLCANCHRIVHRKRDGVLTIEELKNLIQKEQVIK